MHKIIKYFNSTKFTRIIFFMLLVAISILFFMYLGETLIPVFISIVIAYLLDTVVQKLSKNKLTHFKAVLIVYISFTLLFIGSLLIFIPIITDQISDAVNQIPVMLDNINKKIDKLPTQIPYVQDFELSEFIKSIKNNISKELSSATIGKQILVLSWSSFQGIFNALIYIVVIPLMVFFLLMDKEMIMSWFRNNIFPKNNFLLTTIYKDVNLQIGEYVKGKVLEASIVGVATFIVLVSFGIKYALLLSILVGLSVIIPYIGAIVVTIPIVIVALSQWGGSSRFLWCMIFYFIVQLLDGNILVPLLFSRVTKLHPLAIIIAIITFGGLWGFWGAFFAIPLAILLQSIINHFPNTKGDI